MSKNIDPTVLEGNLVRVDTPTTLSLVGLPANQRAFKVVRSDKGSTDAIEGSDTKGGSPATRRVRRSAQNPVLRLAFGGMETDEIMAVLKNYGMEDYTISTEDGVVVATRSDLQTFAKEGTEAILLQRGVTAYVNTPQKTVKRGDERKNLKLAAFEFDAQRHDAESANAWLASHNIDIAVTAPENPAKVTNFVATRSEVAEGVEARRMEIADGVVAVIVLDETLDVPPAVVEVISEAAYGNWGWGQLDFNARLADRAFCEAMSDAVYILDDVIRSLIFYSDLPLDVRQQLITNALTQFNAYVTTMMSALPRQVLVAVARSEKKENTAVPNTATPAAQQEPAVVRNDNEAPAATTEGVQAAAAPATVETPAARADETITLTPAELEERIQAEITKRAAPATEPAPAATTEATPAATTDAEPTLKDLLQRMDDMARANASLTEQVATLVAAKAEPAVVVRSDNAGDEGSVTQNTQRSADPWAGLLTGKR